VRLRRRLLAADLLHLLRRIAALDDVPDTVRADARDYLAYLEAASSGSGSLADEARMAMAATAAIGPAAPVLQHAADGDRGCGHHDQPDPGPM
jgi:hypothetical protein